MKLTLQQLEAHLWGAANILRGKTAGQDYKNYILSLMFYKRLCDQWECEADEAIAEQERQQERVFSEKEKAVFRKRGEHRFQIPEGARWGDVKAAATNLGEVLTKAMRAVPDAYEGHKHVFHNPIIFAPRLSDEQWSRVAQEIGRRLEHTRGKAVMMLPLQGTSRYSIEGGPLHDPDGDAVFFTALRESLPNTVEIVECDADAEAPPFVDQAVDRLIAMLEDRGTHPQSCGG